MNKILSDSIARKFSDARRQTLQMFELADESILHESPGFGFRPILWHLAHIGAFEEFWLLQKLGNANPVNERFQIIFDPIKTPRESSKNLPTKAEMREYLQTVRDKALENLQTFDFASDEQVLRNGYVFDLVLQHELQHQETLAYLFHLLPLEKVKSLSNSDFEFGKSKSNISEQKSKMLTYEACEIEMGSIWNEFAYDNEIPANNVFIPAFKLDRFLTTNEDFSEFIAEKGYEKSEFWSEEGWNWREKENWQFPLYWRKNGNDWMIRTMFEENSLSDLANHPVYGVSFYEAEAYAKFRGKRLASEFEWERAASWNEETKTKQRFATCGADPLPKSCNFEFHFRNTTPVDSFSQTGSCFDLNGNLWEWTSSDFAAYSGFEPFPYPEYSQEWFDGDHKVLRGGSFATSKEMLRTSFRNFFRRHFRIAFAGIRLAADA